MPSHPSAKIDNAAIEAAVIVKVQENFSLKPSLGHFLLEYCKLAPYADTSCTTTGKPVHSILDAARLLAR